MDGLAVRPRLVRPGAPVLTLSEHKRLSPRQRHLHDLHRATTYSNLPILETPMSAAIAQAMRRRIEANAAKLGDRTRPGLLINGAGQQGKTETACKCAAEFEDDWLQLTGYLNPDAVSGTRDLLAPVAYVRVPVNARPSNVCEAILEFYGEDYKGMRPDVLKRTVKRALKDHATKVLILDDITRLKMHRETDQDTLDLIRDLMYFTVVVVLIGVGIPKSGLLREGRVDPRTGDWLFPPVCDKSKSPNDEAATQTERRFKLVLAEVSQAGEKVTVSPDDLGAAVSDAVALVPPGASPEAGRPAPASRTVVFIPDSPYGLRNDLPIDKALGPDARSLAARRLGLHDDSIASQVTGTIEGAPVFATSALEGRVLVVDLARFGDLVRPAAQGIRDSEPELDFLEPPDQLRPPAGPAPAGETQVGPLQVQLVLRLPTEVEVKDASAARVIKFE